MVEDDPFQHAIMLRMLRVAGHVAEGAKDAAEALDMIERERFDCMVLDWLMAGLTGADFIAVKNRVERLLVRERSPVLLISISEHAKEACPVADAFLYKPIQGESLTATLRGLIGA